MDIEKAQFYPLLRKLEEKNPTASGIAWTIQNQGILQKIFKEQRYEVRLRKNRIEKLRARKKRNLENF